MYKFRGKRIDNGEWVEGSLVYVDGVPIIIHKTKLIVDNKLDKSIALAYSEDEIAVVIPETVGMFTGLKDKNGKEVYQGDTVKAIYYNHNSPDTIFIQEVVFDKGGFFLKTLNANIPSVEDYDLYRSFSGLYQFFNPTPNKIEIIGNIHDQPLSVDLTKTTKRS